MDLNAIINWSPGTTLDYVEKQAILIAFRFYRGNKTQTANSLGIAIRTLDNKLERYEKEGKAEKEREEHERQKRYAFLARQRGLDPSSGATITDQSGLTEKHMPSADTGVRVESTQESTEKSAVPVSQRKEVQAVLSHKASSSGATKTRGAI